MHSSDDVLEKNTDDSNNKGSNGLERTMGPFSGAVSISDYINLSAHVHWNDCGLRDFLYSFVYP